MNDCKTCKHATALFELEKDSRFSGTYKPSGFVRCKGPHYGGRTYFCRDSKDACSSYEKKKRET